MSWSGRSATGEARRRTSSESGKAASGTRPSAEPDGEWEYEVSKPKLAEVLWPVLEAKIERAKTDQTAPVPPIAEVSYPGASDSPPLPEHKSFVLKAAPSSSEIVGTAGITDCIDRRSPAELRLAHDFDARDLFHHRRCPNAFRPIAQTPSAVVA